MFFIPAGTVSVDKEFNKIADKLYILGRAELQLINKIVSNIILWVHSAKEQIIRCCYENGRAESALYTAIFTAEKIQWRISCIQGMDMHDQFVCCNGTWNCTVRMDPAGVVDEYADGRVGRSHMDKHICKKQK